MCLTRSCLKSILGDSQRHMQRMWVALTPLHFFMPWTRTFNVNSLDPIIWPPANRSAWFWSFVGHGPSVKPSLCWWVFATDGWRWRRWVKMICKSERKDEGYGWKWHARTEGKMKGGWKEDGEEAQKKEWSPKREEEESGASRCGRERIGESSERARVCSRQLQRTRAFGRNTREVGSHGHDIVPQGGGALTAGLLRSFLRLLGPCPKPQDLWRSDNTLSPTPPASMWLHAGFPFLFLHSMFQTLICTNQLWLPMLHSKPQGCPEFRVAKLRRPELWSS